MSDDLLFDARLQHVLERTLQAMPAEEKAERVAYCQRTGEHGVRAATEPDGTLRLQWGGRPLALVEPDVFTPEAYMRDLALDTSAPVPDEPPEVP